MASEANSIIIPVTWIRVTVAASLQGVMPRIKTWIKICCLLLRGTHAMAAPCLPRREACYAAACRCSMPSLFQQPGGSNGT